MHPQVSLAELALAVNQDGFVRHRREVVLSSAASESVSSDTSSTTLPQKNSDEALDGCLFVGTRFSLIVCLICV
jgi:hypothetical protein